MTAAVAIPPGAFAVWWKDFSYWQVRALRLAITNKCYWPTVRFGEVAQIRSDLVTENEFKRGQVEFLDRISFDEGRVFSGTRVKTKMVQFRAKPGDIVVSKINARKRAIGIVRGDKDIGITIHFRALIPDSTKIDTEFLWGALRSQFCLYQFEVETGGIGKGEISEERLLAIKVPLPPMAEQKAIVARWLEAQLQIAVARSRVEQKKADMEARFFADLGLNAPAQMRMPKFFAVWWKDVLRWSVSYSQQKQTGLDITQGKFPVVKLGSIVELIQYGTSKKANGTSEGKAVVRMNNILDGELDLSHLKHVRLSDAESKNLLLKDGDILFNRTNSKELVGKCAVFHAKGDFVFASYLIRVCASPEKANPDFLAYVINCPIGRQQINALSRQIIGQANVNSEELRGIEIPLPPLRLQQGLMARVAAIRAAMAREREVAERLSKEIALQLEEMFLGTKIKKEK